MDFLAPVARHLIAPAWALWERSPYLRHHRHLLRTQFDRPDVVRQRQWEKLSPLLAHAYETTAFWRSRLQDAGLRPERIKSFRDFSAVPLLTKADLRADGARMLSAHYAGAKLCHKKTSGSTGTSVQVQVDEAAQQFQRGCTLRSDEWSGWRLGERVAAVWGNPEYLKHGWRGRLRNYLLERQTCLDTLKMDSTAIEAFAAKLRRQPPSLLFGHAHSLYLFAEFLKPRGPAGIRPKGIISTAMVLHDWERRTIEEVFQCKVTNRYGCEEVSLIACECQEHDGMHINADGIYLEVLRPDGAPCAPGEAGMIVVTDLVNRAMPILRYQVGDMGVLSERRCPCGRGLPLLEKIEGRIADYVVTASGELISGISLTENFAVMVPGIAQLQIVQEEVDRFRFRIVQGPEFGLMSLEIIRTLVAERFGAGVRYDCEYVERIPQEPSGKYRFCISKVGKSLLPH
ncbi:MAG: phenylacetate--CoA ligase family protein [Thermoguttaceae bacterium]